MNVVVIVRTRNEERNIEPFCRNYAWADKILVADGGSEDRTVEIAKSMPKTEVRNYPVVIQLLNGYFRNPHGRHINFLIEWAEVEQADWIVFDDCDCWPNALLKQDIRGILERSEKDFVRAVRLYLWGVEQHFPRLAKPGGDWEPSIWAWRASAKRRFKITDHYIQEPENLPGKNEILKLLPPYCLLHHPWPTPGDTEKKVKFYRESGQIPRMEHPLRFGGPLEALPEWAHE